MEAIELPVLELPETEDHPAMATEEEIDLAAFELWRQASNPEPESNDESA